MVAIVDVVMVCWVTCLVVDGEIEVARPADYLLHEKRGECSRMS